MQLVPVPRADRTEIAGGAVVDVGQGWYARLQQVVYTGVYLNEISRIDIAKSIFTADFYLWTRYSATAVEGAADPFRIDLPDLVEGAFDPEKVAEQGELAVIVIHTPSPSVRVVADGRTLVDIPTARPQRRVG